MQDSDSEFEYINIDVRDNISNIIIIEITEISSFDSDAICYLLEKKKDFTSK